MKLLLVNPFFLWFFLWFFVVIGYGVSLSTHFHHPEVFYLVFLATFIIYIAFFSIIMIITQKSTINNGIILQIMLAKINGGMRVLKALNLIFFILGMLASFYIYKEVGIFLFQQAKMSREAVAGGIVHYLGYFKEFLSYQLPISYYLLHVAKKRRVIYFIMIIVSFSTLALNLGRATFSFFFLFVFYYHLVMTKKMRHFFVFISVMLLVFIFLFALVGDIRVDYAMKYIYKTTVSEFYGMAEYPSWFVWIYIYLTSPLENFRDMLLNQQFESHSFGMLLFFPFYQIFFKLFGTSLSGFRDQLTPYLAQNVGLTVSSFMQHALIDFGIFGPFIYVLFYVFMMCVSIYFFKRNVFGLFSLVMATNIAVWSVFANSFAIGTFVIGWLLFTVLSFLTPRTRFLTKTGNG